MIIGGGMAGTRHMTGRLAGKVALISGGAEGWRGDGPRFREGARHARRYPARQGKDFWRVNWRGRRCNLLDVTLPDNPEAAAVEGISAASANNILVNKAGISEPGTVSKSPRRFGRGPCASTRRRSMAGGLCWRWSPPANQIDRQPVVDAGKAPWRDLCRLLRRRRRSRC
jgi:hypothetical protein